MRKSRRSPGHQGVCLADSIEVLKNKSINPLFTKFLFEVDVTDPRFMEFLTHAGEHTDEVTAHFKNTAESISILRKVLEKLPNLVTLGVNLSEKFLDDDYEDPGSSSSCFADRSRKRQRLDPPQIPGPGPLPDPDPIENEEQHLFPPGTQEPLPTFPNLKLITFHSTTSCKFETLARDLILAAPNLEQFDCMSTKTRASAATSQAVHIEKWFFELAVLTKDFPTLSRLKSFNRDMRLQYTNVELGALCERKFPLTRLVIDCRNDSSISLDIMDNLFKHLGPTLRKLDLTLTAKDPNKAKELSRSVQHLSKLEELVVENFHFSLGSIYTHFPKLLVLKVRNFDSTVIGSFVPKPLYVHPLKELLLRDGTARNIPTQLIASIHQLFPKVRELTLSAESIGGGQEGIIHFITSTMTSLNFLFFVRKCNNIYLQMKRNSDGEFKSRRFNENGVPVIEN